MRRTKRLVTVILMCAMMLSTNILAYAATPDHECSYTFVRRDSYGTISTGTHSFIVEYVNGAPQYATCSVSINRYADVYRCGCGAEYKETFGVEQHSSCGK